jgi:hypothetical protein
MGLSSLLMSIGSVRGSEPGLPPMANLGDFLDRGWQGPETIVLICQLVTDMGSNYVQLRGNHEVRWGGMAFGGWIKLP